MVDVTSCSDVPFVSLFLSVVPEKDMWTRRRRYGVGCQVPHREVCKIFTILYHFIRDDRSTRISHISRDNDLSANECVSFLSRHSALNKKYVTRVCESIEELLQKRVSMVFVYSHSSEHCQTILNSLESLGNLHITAS
ncbi:hypothetical protein GBAR_LOCUS26010 [Geodia barretti]|uniref:Uncharacterized protein n=1 Tax=Geodia barretti TaxID=519541 RepID=A0AA35TEX8_GEOBA|nr:hypothetical protein GBAR_LOCUS26010 [Geodia barretti]